MLRIALGIAMLVVGLPLITYAALMDLYHLPKVRRFDRPDVLGAAGLALLVGGVLLTRT